MDFTITPTHLRTGVLFSLISLHMTWYNKLSEKVPTPYLDEVFHIPQAQTYWQGYWSQWDDKITTPPGLYLWSYAFNTVKRITALDTEAALTVDELRFSNIALVYILMVTLYFWSAVAGRMPAPNATLQKEVVLLAFPLLAFFSSLYYTDVFSAWTVVATLAAWESGWGTAGSTKILCQAAQVVIGLLSLATRQTNVFWVVVFLAGLQVVESVQSGAKGDDLNDPEVGVATFEDASNLIIQLISASITQLPSVLLALWPQVILLGSFATFILWNGGVAMGDKSNHVATIHLPQLLYIWPCIVFFSWPVLIHQFRSLERIRQQFPRRWISASVMLAMAVAVHFNTIVHPFTLADNRHYVFYVFRILLRYWWVKYAAVPVYFVCACLVIGALGVGTDRPIQANNIVSLSVVLVWFASTALSLMTAPLVEPRYFILPWLVWRMYIPEKNVQEPAPDEPEPEPEPEPVKAVVSTKKSKKAKKVAVQPVIVKRPSQAQKASDFFFANTMWVELAWYVLVNVVVGWVFLHKGFQWVQEPGKVQRFMW